MNTPNRSGADLHLHTTSSDGTFTPSELVLYADGLGLKTISVTDHDTVGGLDEALRTAQGLGITIIPGIEMGSDVGGHDIHILGYFIDYKYAWLNSYLKELKEFRLTRAEEMIRRLNARGIDVSLDDAMRLAPGDVLTRAHIGKAMVEKGHVGNIAEAFDYYLGRDQSCYVSKYNYSSADVIDAIKKVGGIPVLAHPGVSKVDECIPQLIKDGIMGLEAYCLDHTDKQLKMYKRIAEQNGLLVTGGSDDHGPKTPGRFKIGRMRLEDEYVDALRAAAMDKKIVG